MDMDTSSLHQLPFEPQLSDDDRAFLEDQIVHYNMVRTGFDDFQWLGFLLRRDDGVIVAGISGFTWGGCCEIKILWVDDSLRRQNIGGQLLRMAEEEAAARGCGLLVLDTHSFQAPDFYRKQGYQLVGTYDGYPRGHKKHFFQKQLHASPPAS